MTLKLEFGSSETVDLRSHYEQVTKDTAKLLWRRKWLIAAFLVAPVALAFLALVLMGPRYTAEAMIELGFSRKVGVSNTTRTQESIANIANVDASALVDGAVRLLRSRPIAGAVVTRLGLDNDPRYTRNPRSLQALSLMQTVLGLPHAESTPHERAVNELMHRISVTAQPHSYVISIMTTADRPERATMLVNAVASAYQQNRMMQQVSAAEEEMRQASAIYGARHPQYQLAEMKLRHLEAALNALGEEPKDGAKVVVGDSIMAGDVIVGPSSATIGVVLGIALAVGLACGIWTALHEAAVKMHVKTILGKIRVRDRTQAAIWAMNRIRHSR